MFGEAAFAEGPFAAPALIQAAGQLAVAVTLTNTEQRNSVLRGDSSRSVLEIRSDKLILEDIATITSLYADDTPTTILR